MAGDSYRFEASLLHALVFAGLPRLVQLAGLSHVCLEGQIGLVNTATSARAPELAELHAVTHVGAVQSRLEVGKLGVALSWLWFGLGLEEGLGLA